MASCARCALQVSSDKTTTISKLTGTGTISLFQSKINLSISISINILESSRRFELSEMHISSLKILYIFRCLLYKGIKSASFYHRDMKLSTTTEGTSQILVSQRSISKSFSTTFPFLLTALQPTYRNITDFIK